MIHCAIYSYKLTICINVRKMHYSRRQNKLPIAEQLPNDFTREFSGKVINKFTHSTTIEATYSEFTATFLNDVVVLSRTRPQQLEFGFPSIRAQVLPRPISQLNSYIPAGFYFLFYLLYLLVIGNTEEFKLYNSLKHSLVLSIGYSYFAQFIDYFVC